MNRHLTHILEQQSTPQSTRGMGWQQEQLPQQQQQLNFMINDNNDQMNMFNLPIQGGIKQGTNMDILWDAYGVEDMNSSIPRTISCPPAVAAAMAEAAMGRSIEGVCMANFGSGGGNESMKKRKLDRTQSLKVKEKVETKNKRMKECIEDVGAKMMTEKQSTSFNSNMEPSADNSQENSKVSEIKKQDFIHVRARRGQATDSHSLAERVRREKISERMKFLQDLVPGCNKIIGKAGMLDEIINYVQSLQRQVEFLSMKLSTVNPKIDYDIENLLNEEATPATTHGFSSIGLPSSMANPDNLQFNSLPVPCSGPEANDSQDLALRRTISAPVSLPETLLNQSYLNLNQIQHAPAWDVDLENLYVMEFQQDKLSPSFTPPFTGYTEANQVKLEM